MYFIIALRINIHLYIYMYVQLDTLYESWGLPYTPEGDESRGYIYAQQNIITQDSVSRAPYQDAYATISEKSLVNFQKKDTFQSIPLYEKNINIQSLQQQWEEQLPMYEKITTILQGLEKNIHILLPLQYLFNGIKNIHKKLQLKYIPLFIRYIYKILYIFVQIIKHIIYMINKYIYYYKCKKKYQQYRTKVLYSTIYPTIYLVYEGIHVLYQFIYLFRKTDYYTPWENLQKVCPVRLSQQDIIGRLQRIQKEAYDMNISYSSSSNTIFQRFYRTIRIISRILADSSRYIILIGIFVFKFLEWQNSSQNAVLNKQKLPTPPPPPPPIQLPYFDNTTTEQSTNNNENNSNVKLPSNPSSCSLCQRSKRINTACIPTGFSFCYSCIVDYIEKRHSCPITGVPLDVSSVRRVFDKSSQ